MLKFILQPVGLPIAVLNIVKIWITILVTHDKILIIIITKTFIMFLKMASKIHMRG